MGIRCDALMNRYKKRLGVLGFQASFVKYAILDFHLFMQHCNSCFS